MENKTFEFHKNSFDIIRYFSAFGVMFLHYTYYALTLSEQKVVLLRIIRRITEFLPGVVILFSLSGFLIAASFERCRNKKEYFIKRVFRLYPELWACTLVNMIVLWICVGELLDQGIILWLLTQVVGIANTPACLNSFATGSVNGALWTIFTEVQLYVFLGFCYHWLKSLGKKGWCSVLLMSIGLSVGCQILATGLGGSVAKIIERLFLPYLLWFILGVFCYLKREQLIPVIKKYLWILIIIFVVNQGFNICKIGYYEDVVSGILLPAITIGMAYLLPAKKIRYDLSYGIFLYHWIILNIMVHLKVFVNLPWHVCCLIFTTATLVMAWMSWYWIGRNTKYLVKKWMHI